MHKVIAAKEYAAYESSVGKMLDIMERINCQVGFLIEPDILLSVERLNTQVNLLKVHLLSAERNQLKSNSREVHDSGDVIFKLIDYILKHRIGNLQPLFDELYVEVASQIMAHTDRCHARNNFKSDWYLSPVQVRFHFLPLGRGGLPEWPPDMI